jgi:hypothetical protein
VAQAVFLHQSDIEPLSPAGGHAPQIFFQQESRDIRHNDDFDFRVQSLQAIDHHQ